MTSTVTRGTEIPAVRAASGLSPVARNWKPISLRSSSHHTKTAAASATRKPRCRRKESPSSLGYWEPARTGRDLGLALPSPMKASVVRAWASRKVEIELSMIVVMTSLAPVSALSRPGIAPHSMPPTTVPSTAATSPNPAGRWKVKPM